MSRPNKPVVLNDTGLASIPKIEELCEKIDEDKVSTAESLEALGEKVTENAMVISEKIDTLTAAIPSIIEAMDRLDIIYYVEN